MAAPRLLKNNGSPAAWTGDVGELMRRTSVGSWMMRFGPGCHDTIAIFIWMVSLSGGGSASEPFLWLNTTPWALGFSSLVHSCERLANLDAHVVP